MRRRRRDAVHEWTAIHTPAERVCVYGRLQACWLAVMFIALCSDLLSNQLTNPAACGLLAEEDLCICVTIL